MLSVDMVMHLLIGCPILQIRLSPMRLTYGRVSCLDVIKIFHCFALHHTILLILIEERKRRKDLEGTANSFYLL